MCGICGIVDYSGQPIDHDALIRMRDVMTRRGPDDAGARVLPYAALGHRRLSIIDLSPRGRQPMTNEDETVWLVFNGEIYDYEPLRHELMAARHAFVSESDSEVLVHGYEQWGIDGLVSRINGMFAFAIWDAPRRELHLVRDRLGKKPLYYGWRDGQFVFASELKALWALAPGEWKPHAESIARFLYWSYVPGRETCYADVYQLLPAHLLTLTANGHRERRYWRVSFADKTRASVAEMDEQTDAILAAAVRRRLRSDVPLGAFLSGGVDSSYVVSQMAGHTNGPVRTIAMGTSDRAHDEREPARRVAAFLGTAHEEFEVTADAWGLLPRLVAEFGQPFADAACIPTYYVARHARQFVTVALTGDGGDESFAGYSHHQGRYLASVLKPFVPDAFTDRLLDSQAGAIDYGAAGLRASASRFLRYLHPDPLVRWSSVDHWSLHHLPRLWSPQYRELAGRDALIEYAQQVDADFDGTSELDRALHLDLNVLLPFCYNVKLDVATMMSSLEARSPFQDREVVEWAARLPASVKMSRFRKKEILKRVTARHVPRDTVYRPKHGFSLPVDRWFRGPWANAAHQLMFSSQARGRGFFDYDYLEQMWTAHRDVTANHGMRLWSILWLELWLRTFIDRGDSVVTELIPAVTTRHM
jgi:asparagine synthase (glutamine-hydrolysing)